MGTGEGVNVADKDEIGVLGLPGSLREGSFNRGRELREERRKCSMADPVVG
jgi:hypothetical protein